LFTSVYTKYPGRKSPSFGESVSDFEHKIVYQPASHGVTGIKS